MAYIFQNVERLKPMNTAHYHPFKSNSNTSKSQILPNIEKFTLFILVFRCVKMAIHPQTAHFVTFLSDFKNFSRFFINPLPTTSTVGNPINLFFNILILQPESIHFGRR